MPADQPTPDTPTTALAVDRAARQQAEQERDDARAEAADLRQHLTRIVTNAGSHYKQLIAAARGALSPGAGTGAADYWRWTGQAQVIRETTNEIARIADISAPDWEQIKASVPADGVYRRDTSATEPALGPSYREQLRLARTALTDTGYLAESEVSDDIAPRIIEMHSALTDDRDQARAEAEQLRYERRLLGHARMTLDLIAAGDETRWAQARAEAEDLAQRIVDEIGHPVTDEPALGPDLRAQLAAAEAERDDYRQRLHATSDAANTHANTAHVLRRELERVHAAGWRLVDRMEKRADDGYSSADCTAMAEFADELRAILTAASVPGANAPEPDTELLGDLDRADRWMTASGIPIDDREVPGWLDNLGLAVPTGIRTLLHVIRTGIISAGEAGWRYGRQTATTPRPDVDRIAQAIGDPGSVVGPRRGPSWGEGHDSYAAEEETVTRWATHAVLALLAETVAALAVDTAGARTAPAEGTRQGPADVNALRAAQTDGTWSHTDHDGATATLTRIPGRNGGAVLSTTDQDGAVAIRMDRTATASLHTWLGAALGQPTPPAAGPLLSTTTARDPHATAPAEAYDQHHPDHDWWCRGASRCLDTDCPSHHAEPATPDPCQPIGCDHGHHLPGCAYASVDQPAAPEPGPQEIPPEWMLVHLRRANIDAGLDVADAELLDHARTDPYRGAIISAYRLGYAARNGNEITVSAEGDYIHIGDCWPDGPTEPVGDAIRCAHGASDCCADRTSPPPLTMQALDQARRDYAQAEDDEERADVIGDLLADWYQAWPDSAATDPHQPIAAEILRIIGSTSPAGSAEPDPAETRARALDAATRLMAGAELDRPDALVRDLEQTTVAMADRLAEWIATGDYDWTTTGPEPERTTPQPTQIGRCSPYVTVTGDWVHFRDGGGRHREGPRSPACPGDDHRHDIRCIADPS